jgi:hypothetical protein
MTLTNEWRKATKSLDTGCVEVRRDGNLIQVRDTKDHDNGAILGFTEAEWDAFIDGAKNGEFDL